MAIPASNPSTGPAPSLALRSAGNVTFLCPDKDWMSTLGSGSKLPVTVTVGLGAPWREMPCPLCRAPLKTAKVGFAHFIKKHQARKVNWFCLKCNSSKPGLLSAACHAAKCGTGTRVRPTAIHSYVCGTCSSSFSTKRGLSMHAKKHGSAGCVPRLVEPDENPNSGFEGLFSPLPPPKDKVGPRPVGSLKSCLERTIRDGEIPPGGLHPLRSSPALVNRTLSGYIKQMRRSNKIYGRKPWKPRGFGVARVKTRCSFRTIQNLYTSNMAAAASLILDGKEATSCNIPLRAIETAYSEIWEKDDRYMELGVFGALPEADNEPLLMAVTPNEVMSALRGSKGKSAPGPDGIRKPHLLRWDKDGKLLASLYNTILYNSKLPKLLKNSRTTLVPKSPNQAELKVVDNWRPITLSSSILRLFSKILCARLSEACPTHPSQKGFTRGVGCSTNLMLLDGVIRRAVRQKETLAVVFIDLARAFDSVSHKLIREVLARRKVDSGICDLISDAYSQTSSRVVTKRGRTRAIQLKVGVKQGDPMSPLLFNLCLDPLLTFLDLRGSGYTLSGQRITALAYADDLVLLSGSWAGMAVNLKILERFLELTGLDVKIKKCGGFLLRTSNRNTTVNHCADWMIHSSPIPWIGETQSYRYLGVEVSPKRGILPSDPLKEILPLLRKISKAPLKPTQKVKMLITYGIPRVVYGADMSLVGTAVLRKVDREIRNAVKAWLHLSPSTADGLFYSSRVDGGLGLPRLEKQIAISQVKRWCRTMQANDAKCKVLAPALLPKVEIAKRWKVATGVEAEGNLQASLATTDPAVIGKRWRVSEFERWCGLRCQGRGLATFARDPISNHWLGVPWGLHESDYILALQLRSSTVRTLTTLSRGRRMNTTCRACGRGWEGIIHVVSQCRAFKKNRMANHNNICRLLSIIGRALGWEVTREKRITCPLWGTAVPDLILTKNGRGLVVDVAVCYEAKPGTLRRRAEFKVNKYDKFSRPICNTLGLSGVKTFGFVMGARGKWHAGNAEVLNEMGLPRSRKKALAKLFTVRAIRGTTGILKTSYCSVG
uniref:Reverse transcriptase domain-containing protein n=1 Tax=Poecilia latipinna TaxID=48699 RepID=A0A3B3W1G7_9TELE